MWLSVGQPDFQPLLRTLLTPLLLFSLFLSTPLSHSLHITHPSSFILTLSLNPIILFSPHHSLFFFSPHSFSPHHSLILSTSLTNFLHLTQSSSFHLTLPLHITHSLSPHHSLLFFSPHSFSPHHSSIFSTSLTHSLHITH